MHKVPNNSWPEGALSGSKFSPYQLRVLTVLTLINFVNWIDRQIVYPLFPLLKDEFHVTYAQLGWLVAAFSLVHAVGSFGLGQPELDASLQAGVERGLAVQSPAAAPAAE